MGSHVSSARAHPVTARRTRTPLPTHARAMDAVRRIVHALHRSARDVERAIGLSGAQLFVLQQLEREPADSVNELAARTITHQSSVSVVVQRLVQRGLVRRSRPPGDRRRVHLEITGAGSSVLRRAPTTAQAQLVAGLNVLPPRRVQTLARALEQWLDAARFTGPAALFFEDDGRTRARRAGRAPRSTRRG
jgi:DNA-binding MarR family transcriptional regulator